MEDKNFIIDGNGSVDTFSSQKTMLPRLQEIVNLIKHEEMHLEELQVKYKSKSFFKFFEDRIDAHGHSKVTRATYVTVLNYLKKRISRNGCY